MERLISCKFFRWTTDIQGALSCKCRHKDPLMWRKNFRGFTHETNARDNQGLRWCILAKARHLQRISHASTCFFSQILYVTIYVVVRNKRGLQCIQPPAYTLFNNRSFFNIDQALFDRWNFFCSETVIRQRWVHLLILAAVFSWSGAGY